MSNEGKIFKTQIVMTSLAKTNRYSRATTCASLQQIIALPARFFQGLHLPLIIGTFYKGRVEVFDIH